MNTGYVKPSRDYRQRAVDLRSEAEKILARAQQLSEPDRALVTAHIGNTNSFRQISQLTGISEMTVARRIRKILATLRDDRLNALLTSEDFLSRHQKRIIRDYFFGGLTVRDLARRHRMSYYNARRIIGIVRRITQQGKYTTSVRSY